jgi:hypothetical protein
MSGKPYTVATYEPLQVSPCVGSGLRAFFSGSNGEPGHAAPVAAMAVCRVTRDLYQDGRKVHRIEVVRELCGVITYLHEGFGIAEQMANFVGYLQPGESEPSGDEK